MNQPAFLTVLLLRKRRAACLPRCTTFSLLNIVSLCLVAKTPCASLPSRSPLPRDEGL